MGFTNDWLACKGDRGPAGVAPELVEEVGKEPAYVELDKGVRTSRRLVCLVLVVGSFKVLVKILSPIGNAPCRQNKKLYE